MVQLPDLDTAKLVDSIRDVGRDAAYVAIGFGVLAFQRAQVHRRQLMRQINSVIATLS